MGKGKNGFLESFKSKIAKLTLSDYMHFLILFFTFLGVILCVYLWWVHLSEPDTIVCNTGGCADTLKGEYSELFGVPVAFLGLLFYSIIAGLTVQSLIIKHKLIDWMLSFILISGVVFTLYLRYLEFAKIGDICIWCWMSVLLVLLICFAYLISKSKVNKVK